MKTPVLLLKTRSTPHDGYEEYFSKKEYYDPVFIPVLQHCFNHENLRAVKELFISGAGQKTKEKYGGLIFTSQRAVEGFAQMVTEIGGMMGVYFALLQKTSHTLLLMNQTKQLGCNGK
jgi:uroporphyrinogen-III synthase